MVYNKLINKLIHNENFIKGVIGILAVIILATTFEIILYYTVVKNTFIDGVDLLLEESESLDIPNIPGGLTIKSLIIGLSENDESEGNYINNLKLTIMIFLIVVIFLLLIYFFNRLYILELKGRYSSNSDELKAVFVNVILIFFVIVIFQLITLAVSNVFNFGGGDELLMSVYNIALEIRGKETIPLPSGNKLLL